MTDEPEDDPLRNRGTTLVPVESDLVVDLQEWSDRLGLSLAELVSAASRPYLRDLADCDPDRPRTV